MCVYVCVLFYISLVLNCDAIEIYFKYATLQMGDIRGPFFPQVKYSISVYKIYKKAINYLKNQLDIFVIKLDPLEIINGKIQNIFPLIFYIVKILKNIVYTNIIQILTFILNIS